MSLWHRNYREAYLLIICLIYNTYIPEIEVLVKKICFCRRLSVYRYNPKINGDLTYFNFSPLNPPPLPYNCIR